MADTKISDMTAASDLTGAVVPIVQAGVNKKAASTLFGGTPGGSDTQVQFNDGGTFGGDAGLVFNKTTNALTLGGALQEAKGADIASAGTTDIGAATGNYLDVTGTTTITALGTIQAGTRRIVNFTGALTLTHHATSLILPTGANITTAAGDVAEFVSLGSGNWKCTSYTRANGKALTYSLSDLGIDLTSVSCSVSAGTMTLDLDSKQQRKFYDSSAISSAFTIAFSNSSNAELFMLHLLITGGVAITMPSSVVMEESDTRWNNGTKILTLTGGTGSGFQLSFSKRGSVFELLASSKFHAS